VTGAEQHAAAIPVAADLVCLVRDEDLDRIKHRIDAHVEWDEDGHLADGSLQKLYALIVVLAAMVPDDARSVDMLAWLEPGTRERDSMLRKAHSRAALRSTRGLPSWGPLERLEAEYQRRMVELRKAVKAAEKERRGANGERAA
jgi:hypothetical protein